MTLGLTNYSRHIAASTSVVILECASHGMPCGHSPAGRLRPSGAFFEPIIG